MLKKIAMGLLMVFYVHLFMHFSLWDFSGADSVGAKFTRILGIVTLVVLIVGMLGVVLAQSWGRLCLLAGNIVYLGFGVFEVHFRWTFWLFNEPALAERIWDTAPSFLLGIVLPVIIIFVLFQTRRTRA